MLQELNTCAIYLNKPGKKGPHAQLRSERAHNHTGHTRYSCHWSPFIIIAQRDWN